MCIAHSSFSKNSLQRCLCLTASLRVIARLLFQSPASPFFHAAHSTRGKETKQETKCKTMVSHQPPFCWTDLTRARTRRGRTRADSENRKEENTPPIPGPPPPGTAQCELQGVDGQGLHSPFLISYPWFPPQKKKAGRIT